MKILVFLLILANLLFYAYGEGYLGKPENPDAARLDRQMQAERIRIVSRGEEPPLPAASGQPEDAAPPDAPAAEAESKPAAGAAKICLSWGHLPASEVERLNSLIASRFPDFAVNRQAEGGGWWIYIPPQASKAEAEKKASELRQLGIGDYFIVQDGPNRFAISLGIFTNEKGGQERLAELKGKGVRSARLVPRPGKDGTIPMQAEGPAAQRAALLAALTGALAGPTVRDCP